MRAIPEHGALDRSAKVPFLMLEEMLFADMKLERGMRGGKRW